MIGVLSCFWRKRVGGVIVFSLFFLATGLSLALTPPPGTPVVNTVFVDYRDARGNALPRVTASVQTPVSAGVVLKISKQASSDPVAMGALLTYTLHYENTGNAAASNLILVDQLSDYVVFQSATAGGIYTPGPPAGGTVTWALGTLPAGGYGSVSVTVRVKTSSDYPSGDPSVIQTGSQVVNEFSLTSTEASVRGSLATTVGVSANLELSKTQSLAAVRPGGTLTYTVHYRNRGNAPATSVQLRDNLPEGTAYVPGSVTSGGVMVDRTVVWDLGTLAPGAEGSVSFEVTVSPLAREGQVIANSACLLSGSGQAASNTVTAIVSRQASFIFSKKAQAQTVRAGSSITYTLDLSNSGLIPLHGVVVRDALAGGTAFVSADAGGVFSGGSVIWNLGTVEVGESRSLHLTIQVPVSFPANTSLENTAVAETLEAGELRATATVFISGRTAGSVEFLDSTGNRTGFYQAEDLQTGGYIYVRVLDPDQNLDSARAETVLVVVTNETAGETAQLVLTESGPDSGVFLGSFQRQTWGVADTHLRADYTDPVDGTTAVPAEAYIDPFGVVFDAATGTPVAGATVILCYGGTNTPVSPADLPAGQPNQVITGADGRFAFLFVPPGNYCFKVIPPSGYTFPSAVSQDQLPSGYRVVEASYGKDFTLVAGMPPVNFDIPVDPPLSTLRVTKTANRQSAAIGDLVRYTVEVTNTGAVVVSSVEVVDTLPHGFGYVRGSTSGDTGVLGEPTTGESRTLIWSLGTIQPGDSVKISYSVAVGVDSQRGDGRNVVLARGSSLGQRVVSLPVACKVKINEGVFTSRGTIIGKVFLDINSDGVQQKEEVGLGGVVLFLEDGSRVVTDNNGKYSFPGVVPGTHVLRLDKTSLPPGLTPRGKSNRYAGSATSQFVDLPAHGLLKVNFPLVSNEKESATIVTIQVASYPKTGFESACAGAKKLEKRGFSYVRVERIGENYVLRVGVAKGNDELSSVLEEIRKMFPEAIIRKGYYLKDRIVYPEKEKVGEVGASPSLPQNSQGSSLCADSKTGRSGPAEDEQRVRSSGNSGISSVSKSPPLTMEKQILTMSPDLAFLTPENGEIISGDTLRVMVKFPLGASLNLFLNGKPVGKESIGQKIENHEGKVCLAEFIGLRLVAGEKNWLGAEVRDDFGNVRASQEITVICVGRPQGIVIQPEQKEFPADGTSLLKIEAWVVDQGGYRVNYPGFLTVETTSGELVGQDADPGESGFQVACVDGVARFYLRAPLQPGEATIVVGYDQLQETRKIFFAPHLRNLFLVGLGEITVGHGQKSGDTEFLRKERWFRENWYAGGRGAFFLKGKVSQDILLTASYDSHKESTPDYFNHRLINTESDELYPIYGDESRLGFEALSREKLYVRLDRNRSYLMYGDIRTDFSDTVLTAFTRTLTGIKTEVKTKKVQVKAFASRTDQTQKMEAIPGRGISGYYYLSGVPVVEGSELVVIETRDRRQTERVLKREGRVRGTDYVVDYDSGGILFKEPVPSHDSDFNPVFIVVSYETSGGQSHYLYGTRALVKVQPWIEVGLTAIREENEISDYLLSGADLTLRLPGKTVLKAEWARSRSLFEEAGVLAPKSDGGWMVNLESHPTEKLSLLAHYRETGTWFGNLSAIDAMRGMRKYSLDVAYLLNNSLTLRGRTLQEDDTLNQMKHRYAGLGLEKKSGPTSFLIEFYHETARGTYVAPPDPNSRFPFDIREDIPERSTAVRFRVERQLSSDFSLSLEHRQNFLSTEDVISQFGVDYRLEKNRKLYLRQQYGQYAGRTEMRTALGVEAEVFRNTVAFNEYRLSDGLDGGRNQQAIGLRNRFLLGPDITGDIRIENLTTVSGRERQEQPDGLAVATGVEYLPADNLKLTGRLEYRHQSSEDTYLGEVGAAYRLKSDLYGLFRQRFFLDNMDSGQRRTGRTLLGLAYRPLEDDRFNGLLRLEFKNDKDTMTDSGYRGNAYIISAEVNYQTSAQTQWSGKYAGKLSLESGFTHYTDLISGRVLRDITDRFDFALEARLLRSRLAHSLMVGGSMEVGYRLIKNVWLSLGYSFDDFDTDLVGDSYQGKGPYLKIRFKFDESIVKALPGRQ